MSDSALINNKYHHSLAKLFAIDLRGLAAFRVGLAFLALWDLVVRCSDIEVFYTDFGVLPRNEFIGYFTNKYLTSLYFMGGTTLFASILIAVHMCFVVMLLVGYRTRLANFFVWFMLISLQARNPYILQGGDVLFRLMFFWGMFMPLGARWSVDAALKTEANGKLPKQVFSAGTVGFILQISMIYWFTMALRGRDWWADYTAVHYSLHLDHFAKLPAVWIRQYPELMEWMTRGASWVEILGPIFVIFGGVLQPLRLIGVLLLFGLHIGFFACMALGLFPFISMLCWVPLIPSWCWDWLEAKAYTTRSAALTLTVSGDSAVAMRWAKLVTHALLLRNVTINCHPGNGMWTLNNEETGRKYTGATALGSMFSLSPVFWPLGWLGEKGLVPFRWLYAVVDRNEGWIARRLMLLKTGPNNWQLPRVLQVLAVVFLAYVTYWNFTTLNKPTVVNLGSYKTKFNPPTLKKEHKYLGYALRLDQKWSMFAPRPMRGDGWFIMPAVFDDKSQGDLLKNGEPVIWDKPEAVIDEYKNQRWRKYLMNLWMAMFKKQRPFFTKYMCRMWNRDQPNGKKVLTFNLIYIKEATLYDGAGPYECVSLRRTWCSLEGKKITADYIDNCTRIALEGKAERLAREACNCQVEPGSPKKCVEGVIKRHAEYQKRLKKEKVSEASQKVIDASLSRYKQCLESGS